MGNAVYTCYFIPLLAAVGVTCPLHALIRPACQNHGFTHSEYSDWARLFCGYNEQYVSNDMGGYVLLKSLRDI